MLHSLIHVTQTRFVKEHSILDNIFTFCEAVSLSRLEEFPLSILLLDFEKAYNKVDWGFLEETMLCMGFSNSWICGVAAMFRTTHSRVLLAGDKGDRFSISQSI